MFSNCPNLKEIPDLDVSNGTDFNHMFAYSGDGSVVLDLSKWKNDNYANVEYLVQYAEFKDIKLPKEWKINNMNHTFTNVGVESLDLSEFDTSEVTTMQYTFYNTGVKKLVLGNTSKVRSLRNAFGFSQKLKSLNAFDGSSITDTSEAFRYVDQLVDFGGVLNISCNLQFEYCYNLSYQSMLNILNGLAKVTNSRTLKFDQYNVDMLSDDDIAIATSKGWNVSPTKSVANKVTVTSLSDIPSTIIRIHPRVYDCSQFTGSWGDSSKLKSNIPNSSVKTAEISLKSTVDASYMFADTYVYYVTLTDTENVRSMKGMFYDAPFLKEVTMLGDVSKVTDVTDMFAEGSSSGTFYYNPQYNYSKIINALPSGWVAKPIE